MKKLHFGKNIWENYIMEKLHFGKFMFWKND